MPEALSISDKQVFWETTYLETKRILSKAVNNKIRLRPKQPPKIYGLTRIHKAGIHVPLRSLVSCLKTFADDLFAYLADMWSPLKGNSDFTVSSSALLVCTINGERIQENEFVMSFDVESLFTDVPIDVAVQAAWQKLENDPSLPDRTTLTYSDHRPPELCIEIYVRTSSTMDQEEQAVTSSPCKPRIMNRYVDGTFTILACDSVESLLQHLKYQQPYIRSTMETESGNDKLAFLDTAVTREPGPGCSKAG